MPGLVAATETCVAVGTTSEVDGETKLVLARADDPTGAAAILVFDGRLRSEGSVRIVSVTGEKYLEGSLDAPMARVRIWVNHPTAPDLVVVEV